MIEWTFNPPYFEQLLLSNKNDVKYKDMIEWTLNPPFFEQLLLSNKNDVWNIKRIILGSLRLTSIPLFQFCWIGANVPNGTHLFFSEMDENPVEVLLFIL